MSDNDYSRSRDYGRSRDYDRYRDYGRSSDYGRSRIYGGRSRDYGRYRDYGRSSDYDRYSDHNDYDRDGDDGRYGSRRYRSSYDRGTYSRSNRRNPTRDRSRSPPTSSSRSHSQAATHRWPQPQRRPQPQSRPQPQPEPLARWRSHDNDGGDRDPPENSSSRRLVLPAVQKSFPLMKLSSDRDASRLMMSYLSVRGLARLGRVSKLMQVMTSEVIMLIERLDVETDLCEMPSDREGVPIEDMWPIKGRCTCHHVDDAWLARHAAHLKHVSLWRHTKEERTCAGCSRWMGDTDQTSRKPFLDSLIKYGHQSLVSLVNLQITAEDAEAIVNALGTSGSFRSLSHVNVDVFGTITESKANDIVQGEEFHLNFRRDVDTVARFLALCPALTSLGISETNAAPAGLRLVDLFPRAELEGTPRNLRSLSLQVHLEKFDLRDFTRGARMDSVVNLRICARFTDAFSRHGFLSDIATYFPSVTFLYIAYRYVRVKESSVHWCGTEERRASKIRPRPRGNAIRFPANLRGSLTTLAIDRCFVSEQNISRLQRFKNLNKLIVVTPTTKLYNEHHNSGKLSEKFILRSEDVQQYRGLLYCGGSECSSSHAKARRRIALEELTMDAATNWTAFVPSLSR